MNKPPRHSEYETLSSVYIFLQSKLKEQRTAKVGWATERLESNQLATCCREIAEGVGINRQYCNEVLRRLDSEGLITKDSKGKRYTIITIHDPLPDEA